MVLVLDWDGTCTVADSLVEATKRFGDPGVYDRTFRSYGEALAGEVATIRASEAKVSAWAVENVRLALRPARPRSPLPAGGRLERPAPG